MTVDELLSADADDLAVIRAKTKSLAILAALDRIELRRPLYRTVAPTVIERRSGGERRHVPATDGVHPMLRLAQRRGGVQVVPSRPPRATIHDFTFTPTEWPATFDVGATFQIIPTPAWIAGVDGDPPNSSPTYESSNEARATVDSAGNVLATGVGAVTITIRWDGTTKTLSGAVTTPDAVVDHVVVTPSSVSGTEGGSTSIGAEAQDASNDPVPGKVYNWSSNDTNVATVEATGPNPIVTYVAPGNAVITCTVDSIYTDTCAVEVTAAVGGGYANAPSGWTTLLDEAFSATSEPEWNTPWTAGTNVAFFTDGSGPTSAPTYMRRRYASGAGVGSSTNRTLDWRGVGGYRKLFIGWTVWHSDPWTYHSSATNKMLFVGTSYSDPGPTRPPWEGGAYNSIIIALRGTSEVSAQVQVAVQTPPVNGAYKPYNIGSASTTVFWELGTPHRIELQLESSTNQLANGKFTLWIDGTKVAEYTNINYDDRSDHPEGLFKFFKHDAYWGGSGGNTHTQDDYIYDDDLLVLGTNA